MAPRLDLKLFVHHGSYVRGRIAGRDELAGSDVILVHRLLKGATASRERDRGFALFTSSAVEALGIDGPALGLAEARESIEHLGEVTTHVLDLEERWQAEAGRRRLELGLNRLLLDLSVTVGAEPAVAWSHLTSPALRPLWEGPIVIEESAVGGRRGIGTTSQCVTGRLATLEEIVDWQPYDHVGWRLAIPGIGPVAAAADFAAANGETTIRLRWAVPPGTTVPQVEHERIATEKRAAFERLARVLERASAPQEERMGST
jgi:hypothetical protein